jgi:hypothetical protein
VFVSSINYAVINLVIIRIGGVVDMLVGKVNIQNEKYDEDAFFGALECLMYKYGVNRVEAYWGLPCPCSACDASPCPCENGENQHMVDIAK